MNDFFMFIRVLLFVMTVCTTRTQACEMDRASGSYPPLLVDGGFLVFGPIEVLEDEGKLDPEMGIGVSFIDCSTGTRSFIARLPYVADPGEVKDAFLLKTLSDDKEVFVIHSAPIHAFTGVSYNSDYFSVIVFNRENGKFFIDRKLTDYFGSGADIVIYGDDGDTPIYTYPYKLRGAVVDKLNAESYKHWFDGSIQEVTITSDVLLYSTMTVADPTEIHLMKGSKIVKESISAGWAHVLYKSVIGKEVRGWILCEDIGGC